MKTWKEIRLERIQKSVVRDEKFLYTILSYAMVLLIFTNLNVIHSPIVGSMASLLYFLINGIFLGSAFFRKEDLFFKWLLGSLLLIVFLGFFGWVVLIVYNLDIIRSMIVLCVVATSSSLLNRFKAKA